MDSCDQVPLHSSLTAHRSAHRCTSTEMTQQGVSTPLEAPCPLLVVSFPHPVTTSSKAGVLPLSYLILVELGTAFLGGFFPYTLCAIHPVDRCRCKPFNFMQGVIFCFTSFQSVSIWGYCK